MVTTFLGGQVRVIWGYLDSQKLQVQLSELRQFKSSSLYKDLADVIQWALPVVRGDTTLHIAMPSIAESEEESEEEEAAEDAAAEEEDTEIEIKEDPSLQTPLSDSQVYDQISLCSTCKSGKRRRSKKREKVKKRRR